MPLTINEIKENLPAVKILTANGHLLTGKLTGRRNPFATVSVKVWGGTIVSFEFSWAAIQKHLNFGKPLNI